MYRKFVPAYRISGVTGGGITVSSRKPGGTDGRIREKRRKPDPAGELKRKICRVFSFSGLPPEFLGASRKFREGPPTFLEGPEAFSTVLETLQTVSTALAGQAGNFDPRTAPRKLLSCRQPTNACSGRLTPNA
jgi:hypothetical protein